MGPSLTRLLLLRSPIAWVEGVLLYWGLVRLYSAFLSLKGPVWGVGLQFVPPDMSMEELHYLLESLPQLPALGQVLPWLLPIAPLYVLSLWLHDAVWDHGCLWMLGGLKEQRGFHTTLIAESEALQVGVWGAAAGLLTSLPAVGWLLSVPLGIVGLYFWVLRGVSLAAFHGCPSWKGILATVLHALLIIVFGIVLLLLVVFMFLSLVMM